jgi:hypothetical protein
VGGAPRCAHGVSRTHLKRMKSRKRISADPSGLTDTSAVMRCRRAASCAQPVTAVIGEADRHGESTGGNRRAPPYHFDVLECPCEVALHVLGRPVGVQEAAQHAISGTGEPWARGTAQHAPAVPDVAVRRTIILPHKAAVISVVPFRTERAGGRVSQGWTCRACSGTRCSCAASRSSAWDGVRLAATPFVLERQHMRRTSHSCRCGWASGSCPVPLRACAHGQLRPLAEEQDVGRAILPAPVPQIAAGQQVFSRT